MRDEFRNTQNWHRRFLPHYNAQNKYQMITYRLSDSLPQNVLKHLNSHVSSTPLGSPQASAENKLEEAKKRKLEEEFLDNGYGS